MSSCGSARRRRGRSPAHSCFSSASTDGGVVRIASGLKTGESVVLNVPDEIVDGSRIQPIAQLRN